MKSFSRKSDTTLWGLPLGSHAYALMGKLNEARRIMAEMKATTNPVRFSNVPVAQAYTALGNKDGAFRVLFRLVEEAPTWLPISGQIHRSGPAYGSALEGALRRMNLN